MPDTTTRPAHAGPVNVIKELIEKVCLMAGRPTPGGGEHAAPLSFWAESQRRFSNAAVGAMLRKEAARA